MRLHNRYSVSPMHAWVIENGLFRCEFCGLWHGGLTGRIRRFLWFKLGLTYGPFKTWPGFGGKP